MIDIEQLTRHLQIIAEEGDGPDDDLDFSRVVESQFPAYLSTNFAVGTRRMTDHMIGQGAEPMEALMAATEVSLARLFWLAYRTGRRVEAQANADFAALFGGDYIGDETGSDHAPTSDTDDSDG
jgi:hypothetical protein